MNYEFNQNLVIYLATDKELHNSIFCKNRKVCRSEWGINRFCLFQTKLYTIFNHLFVRACFAQGKALNTQVHSQDKHTEKGSACVHTRTVLELLLPWQHGSWLYQEKNSVLLHVRAQKCDVYASVTEFLVTQFPRQTTTFPADLWGGGVAPMTARTSTVAPSCSAPAPHHWTHSASHWHNRCSGVFRSSSVKGPPQWNPRLAFLPEKVVLFMGSF